MAALTSASLFTSPPTAAPLPSSAASAGPGVEGPVEDHHPEAERGQPPDRGRPEPARATGDDG